MKRTIILLFLCFQTLFASIQEYKLEDARVIVCDDFFLPIAKVGVFYSVGLNQLKNISEAEVIGKTFLSETSKKSAGNLGTDIDFGIHDNFSEISAIVANEQIPNIIKIILNNKTDVTDLPLIKDKIKLEYKLSDYFETDFVDNEIYSKVDSKYIFNESILDNITENDLKNSLNKYRKARLNIIICGRFDTKQLAEKLHLKQLSSGDAASVNADQNTIMFQNPSKQLIEARSKFLGRSLYYIYKMDSSKLREKQSAISTILSHEMFDYFKKYSQLADNFFITNFAKPDFILFGFTPKRDISKKSFEISLKSFFSYLKKMNFSHEKLESISKLQKFSEINMDEDISAKYRIIKDRYITHFQSKNDTSKEILTVSPDDIRNFIEQVIENNLITKISTQYKTEN
ncbi:MAG: hypothetical protein K5780_02930 [Alphaproteobacteria bacterium]|nr:hypothetical protein [Alphaproteobacteria bacterium]